MQSLTAAGKSILRAVKQDVEAEQMAKRDRIGMTRITSSKQTSTGRHRLSLTGVDSGSAVGWTAWGATPASNFTVTQTQALDYINESEVFPMSVVPLDVFLSFGMLPRSSDFCTRRAKESDIVIFVSHRWWGDREPDDDSGLKYKIICRGVFALAAERKYKLSNIAIWIDYACIDQDDEKNMAAGIASLISYAARANAMLVPVHPNAEAIAAFRIANHPSQLVDYGERAWCRLETYVATCVSEIRGQKLPVFAYGIASKDLSHTNSYISEKTQLTGKARKLACLPERSIEKLRQLVGDQTTGQLGAAFADKDLPRKGTLTVEGDRVIVMRVEAQVRSVYVTNAIRAECRRMLKSLSRLRDSRRADSNKTSRSSILKVFGSSVISSGGQSSRQQRSEASLNLTGKQLQSGDLKLIAAILEQTVIYECDNPDVVEMGANYNIDGENDNW